VPHRARAQQEADPPPIVVSLSAPLVPTVADDMPKPTQHATGDLRVQQLLAASEAARAAPRRLNPWEHSNRRSFKPIITIGKQSGTVLPPYKRRQLFSLPFTQQRRQAQPVEQRVAAAVPLYAADGMPSRRCGALCVGAAIDVKEVFTHHSALGLRCTAYKDGLNVVVHCQHATEDDVDDAHAYYFQYGCVVLWNFTPQGESRIIEQTRRLFAREPHAQPEVDDFAYVLLDQADAKPHVHKDVIYLSSGDSMEKLAVSFGLGQSAKLSVFERTTEMTIAETRHIPEQLAAGGSISLSRFAARARSAARRAPSAERRVSCLPTLGGAGVWLIRPSPLPLARNEISMRVGQLFVDRSQVNLHSDMLDTPAFFWEEAEWEPLYQRTAKYMEIEKRVSVLNHRLDIIADLFDMLASEMHEKHASNLEIIVIVLIVIGTARAGQPFAKGRDARRVADRGRPCAPTLGPTGAPRAACRGLLPGGRACAGPRVAVARLRR